MTANNEAKQETALVERAQGTGEAIARSSDLDMARALVASGFFPNIKTASQAIVKIQAGRELGFGPVASMMGVHVIQTKDRVSVQLSANMIANLIRRSGQYDFRVTTLTDNECRIRFYRGKQEIGESQFTLEDGKRAGLAQRDVWTHYPRNMLFARAMTNGAKWFCSEVMLGAAMPVGASDQEEESALDVDVETGEIIETEVRVVHEPPEGFKPNWSEFWTVAQQEMDHDKESVHDFFGVPAENGALKDYADARSDWEGKPLTQVVGEMLAELRAGERPANAKIEREQLPEEQEARGDPGKLTPEEELEYGLAQEPPADETKEQEAML